MKRSKIIKSFKGLKVLSQQININLQARIGILGSNATTSRDDKNGKKIQTNSEIGIRHEFGVKGEAIPKRSFLRDPIEQKFEEKAEEDKKAFRRAFESLDFEKAYEKLAVLGEGIVLEAFSTSGYGKWEANKASTIARKGSSMPLIDSSQLRKSITSDVKKK